MRPRHTLRRIRWRQQVGFKQGEQLPIQHTRQIRLPLLLQPDTQHMKQEEWKADDAPRPGGFSVILSDGCRRRADIGNRAVNDGLQGQAVVAIRLRGVGLSIEQPVYGACMEQLPLVIEIPQSVRLQLGFQTQIALDKATHVGTGIPQCRETETAFRGDVLQQPSLEDLVVL
ncbi:hypothetical protein D3C85_1421630 [compost metagenome]